MDFSLSQFFKSLLKLRRPVFRANNTGRIGSHGIALGCPPIPYDLADDFKLGNATVDHQHELIFHLALKASGLAKNPAERERLRSTFHEFGDLLKMHFTQEEQVLSSLKHPKLDQHRAEHQAMLGELESIRRRLAGNDGDWAYHEEALCMLNFMMGVTVGHMLGSDLDCALVPRAA
ncbi:MAG: hemerythrin domain-containing protein [Thiobacillus sp.]|nr:hemerythrin domain-containing protein [Thiobacillus sp.]